MDPKPITLTTVATASYTGLEPQPFVAVGDTTLIEPQPAIPDQALAGTLADLAAAEAAIDAVAGKLNSVLAALRAAGVIAP